MTKIFDLIHLNGHRYAVDKESKEKGQWEIINNELNLLSDDIERTGWLVIATDNITDPAFKEFNLPLLPPIEEFDMVENLLMDNMSYYLTLAEDASPKQESQKDIAVVLLNILGQYQEKAAKAKQYTEEDVRKALQSNKEGLKTEWNAYIDGISEDRFDSVIKALQSLNPLPKQVEIEMIDKEKDIVKYIVKGNTFPEPKVDANNFVNVIKWIY